MSLSKQPLTNQKVTNSVKIGSNKYLMQIHQAVLEQQGRLAPLFINK
jgi:hypothetical protein